MGLTVIPRHERWVTDEPLIAVTELVDRLERAWFPAAINDGSDLHQYAALRIDEFLTGLQIAKTSTTGRRFLEVGCGIGAKMLLAALLGFKVHGIEAREQYAAVAKHLCPEASIEIADARGFDRYRAFDVVYAYRPLVSVEGESALEKFVLPQVADGAIVFWPKRALKTFQGFTEIGRDVWRKG